ncbi:MAG TPA: glycosyltransferase [Candidatus Sulfotelmatobacter sp.]|nr:glycosyltransferase [Candidatus Sulfotelmatobacter sp.]
MRVAIVHDWLTGMRGGERCLEVLCELFPDATLFTLVHRRGSVSPGIERMRIRTSFLQRLGPLRGRFRALLPLFPLAVESFDLRGHDLVVCSSHCVAKGALAPPGARQVAYVYTPMRYVWDQAAAYADGAGWGRLRRAAAAPLASYLRLWDAASSLRVDEFLTISGHVARRIRRCYGREAAVIHPPVDAERFQRGEGEGRYYLVVSALVAYKRVDLAVAACSRLGLPLKVVGEGPQARRLRRQAGPSVEFLGTRSDAEVAALYRGCRAVLFPGLEDFGIVPLEAQAAGRPVIAYGDGGACETIVPLNPLAPAAGAEPTGVFFYDQTSEALAGAVELFEANRGAFDPKVLRDHALAFDRPLFKRAMARALGVPAEGGPAC